MGGQMILSFCQANQILVPQFLLIRQNRQWKLLAMHYNDDGILTKSSEHLGSEIPAVKSQSRLVPIIATSQEPMATVPAQAR